MTNNLEIALTKSKCPVCDVEFDDQIVLNSKLTEKDAKQIKDLNGKIVGLELCSECKKKIGENGVYLIGVDPEQSDNKSVYRTGNIIGITKDAFHRIFNQSCLSNWVYYEDEVINKIKN